MLYLQKAPSSPGGAFALRYFPRCRRTAATEGPTSSMAAFKSLDDTLSRYAQ